MGWGSGTVEFPYLVDPLSAITAYANTDGTAISSSLSDNDLVTAASTAGGKDVAMVFINADSGEDFVTVEGTEGDRYVWILPQWMRNLILRLEAMTCMLGMEETH
jgi:beta-glucosidase